MKLCPVVLPNKDKVFEYLELSREEGRLSNFGPLNRLLSRRLEDYLLLSNEKELVLCSSGHTALMAAYHVLDMKRPLIPSYTFSSTLVAGSIQKGIAPIITDIGKDSICLEKENLFLKEGYDSVVTVCALSTIPNLKSLDLACIESNTPLVIDGAACFGTPFIYNYGDAFCLSFHATKTLPIGEGGAIIVNKGKADEVRRYLNFGMDKNRNLVDVGINGKLSEYACAIGLALLDLELDKLVARRQAYSQYMIDRMPSSIEVGKSSVNNTVYQMLPIYLKDKDLAAQKRLELTNAGIENLQYYRPLINGGTYPGTYPNTVDYYLRNICLPIHQDLSVNDLDNILNILDN